DHDELPRRDRQEPAAVRAGQGVEEPDHEAPDHIDDQRAPRKGLAEALGDDHGAPETGGTADRTADHDPDKGPKPHARPLVPREHPFKASTAGMKKPAARRASSNIPPHPRRGRSHQPANGRFWGTPSPW